MISDYKKELNAQQISESHAMSVTLTDTDRAGELHAVTATRFGKSRAVECFSVQQDDCEIYEMLGPLGCESMAVEIPLREGLRSTAADQILQAIDKESDSMIKRRLQPATNLTDAQKKGALRMRYSITQKRVTPEQQRMGITEGDYKARLVAMDIKSKRLVDPDKVYAPVPGIMAFRLLLGTCDPDHDVLSTTDFVTAYLQADGWEEDMWILVCLVDPRTGETLFYWLTGPVYGGQESGCDWGITRTDRICRKMGFIQSKNAPSIYFHPVRKIKVPVHVDDPFVISKQMSDTVWFHKELDKLFETKGPKILEAYVSIDYLSMRLTKVIVEDGALLLLDNYNKIQEYLVEMGLEKCNSRDTPITTDLIRLLHNNATKPCSDLEKKETPKQLGKFNWLAETTHPSLKLTHSLLAGYASAPPAGIFDALNQVWHWLQGAKDACLVVGMRKGEGFRFSSDSDWAGMYSLNHDTRSRSGGLATFDGFPYNWMSQYQNCKGTEYKEGYDIAQSSCEAEVYALADFGKSVIHTQHICDEVEIAIPMPSIIHVDAEAAIAYVRRTGGGGKMKHIDIRHSWVDLMRDRSRLEIDSIDGKKNPADFFTKIYPKKEFRKAHMKLMGKLPSFLCQSREPAEVLENKSPSTRNKAAEDARTSIDDIEDLGNDSDRIIKRSIIISTEAKQDPSQ